VRLAAAAAAVVRRRSGGGSAARRRHGVVRPVAGHGDRREDGVQEVTIQTPDDYVFVPDTFTVAPGRCG
jgi:plastocyanin